MLDMTEHMKRILYLADQVLVHIQAEKYERAANNLLLISKNAEDAMALLDEISYKKHDPPDPDRILIK